jgi:hypothetical protein
MPPIESGPLRRGVRALAGEPPPADPREAAALAALNGVLGDHLEATGNPLAISASRQIGSW